ncbi:MAG TPA: hypothetical protein VJG32_04320 [Anaerolineae bacterium]|nr:hypothetical protein [Anaerolineae bacterium]
MKPYVLTMIEATGIQDYIFGSNELAQNIGASELVTQATSLWVFERLDEMSLQHNVSKPYVIENDTGQYAISDESFLSGEDRAEVIYASGGNALLLFHSEEKAKDFARRLTRRALADAPDLQLVVARQQGDWESDILKDMLDNLRRKLARRKVDRPFSTPLTGLGVTAACAFTGLPAVARDPLDRKPPNQRRLISKVVQSKLKATEQGKERLRDVLRDVRDSDFEFIYDFDLFGTKGESSYIAVIHTDGNSMGARVKDIGALFTRAEQNADYVRALRAFSRSVNKAATRALRSTVQVLLDKRNHTYRDNGKRLYIKDVVPVARQNQHWQLPFRPIVFGGDDVTFVCEGRLGLLLAAKYLQVYSSHRLSDGKPAHARGGVAVVKSHFPFSRAYDLSERLANSAKKYIQERNEQGEEGLTAFDWHFAVSGLLLDLGATRQREYHVEDGQLYMRPYRLSDDSQDFAHAWSTLRHVMDDFQTKREWAGRRNKIKALRDALREGAPAVQRFLQVYRPPDVKEWRLPDWADNAEMPEKGWYIGECGYFDAIEALDFYVPLEGA